MWGAQHFAGVGQGGGGQLFAAQHAGDFAHALFAVHAAHLTADLAFDGRLAHKQVVVSTRDPNNNLRATVPNPTTGKFTLAYLPENTNYTVAVAGQNLTTAAVTNVPVSLATGVTALNTALTPIQPAASAMADVAPTITMRFLLVIQCPMRRRDRAELMPGSRYFTNSVHCG